MCRTRNTSTFGIPPVKRYGRGGDRHSPFSRSSVLPGRSRARSLHSVAPSAVPHFPLDIFGPVRQVRRVLPSRSEVQSRVKCPYCSQKPNRAFESLSTFLRGVGWSAETNEFGTKTDQRRSSITRRLEDSGAFRSATLMCSRVPKSNMRV